MQAKEKSIFIIFFLCLLPSCVGLLATLAPGFVVAGI
jgi:hypothetical protein